MHNKGSRCWSNTSIQLHTDAFSSLGFGPGWHCLEIGGGGGSVARWLSDQVGADGRVVATDIDTRFLDEIRAPNFETWNHDITVENLPTGEFDLVHTRW